MKIMSIVGARPQFIKLAPLSRYLRQRHQEILVHTGQHYDANMSQVFFQELDIPPPDYNLGVSSASPARQVGEMLARLEEVVGREKPQAMMVYGDTNSTLAGALVAAQAHIPLIHVEAGLRSYNRQMAEEINRVVADHLATLLCCPTENAVRNLAREGITRGVYNTGDVMYDAVLYHSDLARQRSPILSCLGLQAGSYLLATVHRAENTDRLERLAAIVAAFNSLAEPLVWPIHPRTRKMLAQLDLPLQSHIQAMEPVGYLDMLALEMNARAILTDSGGVQKEAYFLGVPCVTLREETEWVETVQAGWNVLAGTERERIIAAAQRPRPQGERPAFFGNGQAHEVIVNLIGEVVRC